MTSLAQGQRVKVSNGGELKERIYLSTSIDENGNVIYICVHPNYEEAYANGEYFRVGLWSNLETEPTELADIAYGDEVMVSNGGSVFKRRIFLGTVGNKILCVHASHNDRFKEGRKNLKTALWNIVKPALKKITREELEELGLEVA